MKRSFQLSKYLRFCIGLFVFAVVRAWESMVYVITAVCVYGTCMRVVVRAAGTPRMCISHQPEAINLGRAAQFKARVYLEPSFFHSSRAAGGGSLFSLGRAAISADLSNLRRDCGRAAEGNISAPSFDLWIPANVGGSCVWWSERQMGNACNTETWLTGAICSWS